MAILNEDEAFFAIYENGESNECEILVSYDDKESGNTYVLLSDNSEDEDGCTRVYVAVHRPEDPDGYFQAVETESEWEMAEIVLEEYQKQIDEL